MLINTQIKALPLVFHDFVFEEMESGAYQTKTLLTYPEIPEIVMKLILIQNQQSCEFETEFNGESKITETFSKVILQILMFIMGK
jgi:hypothetical protein